MKAITPVMWATTERILTGSSISRRAACAIPVPTLARILRFLRPVSRDDVQSEVQILVLDAKDHSQFHNSKGTLTLG